VIAVNGLTGAVDQWLSPEEVERSVEWTRTNTWATGIDDAGAEIACVLAAAADIARREVRTLYQDDALPFLVRAQRDGVQLLVNSAAERAVPIFHLVPEPASKWEKGAVEKALRGAIKRAGGQDQQILLWIEAAEDPETTAELLNAAAAITAKRSWTAQAFDPALPQGRSVGAGLSPAPVLQPPAHYLAALPWLRGRRSSMIAVRRVLEAAAGEPPDAVTSDDDGAGSASDAGFAWTQRSVTATMAGRATIAEDGLFVVLEGGRLNGIYPAPENRSPAGSARALALDWAHGRVQVHSKGDAVLTDEVHGCVAFESEISRGARSTQLIDTESFQALIYNEWSIVTDHPALVMTQTLLANSNQHRVLLTEGLPITGPTTLKGRYHDGSGYQRDVNPHSGLSTAWADAFEVTLPKMRFCLLSLSEDGSPHPWSVSWLGGSDPRLFFGAQIRVPADRMRTAFTLIITAGAFEGSLVEKGLIGTLPHEIRDEVAAGRAATRRSLLVQQEA
jgi:hypothetical protein